LQFAVDGDIRPFLFKSGRGVLSLCFEVVKFEGSYLLKPCIAEMLPEDFDVILSRVPEIRITLGILLVLVGQVIKGLPLQGDQGYGVTFPAFPFSELFLRFPKKWPDYLPVLLSPGVVVNPSGA
jgi:hypothetical protein